MKNVTIVDYSTGNLYSLIRAIRAVGGTPRTAHEPHDVTQAERLIMPGDGAFGDGMKVLRNKNLTSAIQQYLKSKRPFLGICLGMQILFEESEEFGIHQGLAILPGKVVRLHKQATPARKLPHIGWNQISYKRKSPLLRGICQYEYMYFLHSYKVVPKEPNSILCETTYAKETFCSVVEWESIYGCQFHPETSDVVGLQIIQNFLTMAA